MDAQIVFLSLFLGLVSGTRSVELQVTGPVRTVRLTLDGRTAATMTKAPWRANIELGPELMPRELAAIGLDGEGREIARATQVLNLPRPLAELDVDPLTALRLRANESCGIATVARGAP